MTPAKRSKVELPSSSERIRKARKMLREMSKLDQIDLMVKTGLLTQSEADKAKKLAEMST